MILLASARNLKTLPTYELIHARWAMLGAAGFVIPEAFNKFGASCGPEAVWFKTGALLLDGNTLNYFGKNIPINLVVAVVAEVVLLGGAEYYRIINGLELLRWKMKLIMRSYCALQVPTMLRSTILALNMEQPYSNDDIDDVRRRWPECLLEVIS